jgi:hypothetical protein
VIINNDLPRAVSQARSLIGIQDRGS